MQQMSVYIIAYKSQYQKNKLLNQKIDRIPKKKFLQIRNTHGQEGHEKMLNITNYQINANPNYNEVLPHIRQNGHH